MDSITLRRTIARDNFTDTPAKRKKNKPETIFRDLLREIAPPYGCALIAIPDFIHAKGNKIVAHKRPCDDILVTSHGNYIMEAKYGNNPLLPHQEATQSKVNAINGSFYVVRKKVTKKGVFFSVEQNGNVFFKTTNIYKIFEFFQDPTEHYSQCIMMDSMLPSKKRKLNKVIY